MKHFFHVVAKSWLSFCDSVSVWIFLQYSLRFNNIPWKSYLLEALHMSLVLKITLKFWNKFFKIWYDFTNFIPQTKQNIKLALHFLIKLNQ